MNIIATSNQPSPRGLGPEGKPVTRNKRAFTILEIVFVVALLSLILLAFAPYFRTTVESWELQDRRSEILQNARVGMDEMARNIKTATEFLIANPQHIRFRNGDGTRIRYRLVDSELRRGNTPLAEPIDSLTFTYYDLSGEETIEKGQVRLVKIEMTISDSEGKVNPVAFSSHAVVREDAPTQYRLVINEINYNPPGGGANERRREWVELYNHGTTDIDLTDWQISDSARTDDLELGPGETTMTIPADGYAIITANPTQVYSYYTVDPNAIKIQVDDSRIGNGLSNSGETITIKDSSGDAVDSVTYDDSWGGDGDGDTIERRTVGGGSSDPSNWEASSAYLTYTAGSANSITP